MLNNNILLSFFIVTILISQYCVLSQTSYKNVSQFSLGSNVIKAKFSPDYSVLAVLKQGQNAIYSYNPFTFQLIGTAYGQGSMFPQDLQLFGTDIILASQPNQLLVYQRKINSPQLILKQKVSTKINGTIEGIRLQQLNEDFQDKSNLSSARHLVLWHKNNFEVYKYVASEDVNKLTFLFSKTFDNSNIRDVQFHDQKFVIFGLETAGAGTTQLILLSTPNNVTKDDAKLLTSIKSFRAKTASNYLAISYATTVGQWKTKRNTIDPSSNDIGKGDSTKLFYDNNRFIGFYNAKSIQVFRASDNITTSFPNYQSRYSKINKDGEPAITIVAVPQNYTGQFIANDCAEKDCFNYYSLCGINQYYNPNGGLLNNTQKCEKCTSATNCQKCILNNCVKCLTGFSLTAAKKCQTCATTIIGCVQCSQNGSTCYKCDQKQFIPEPISNQCFCKAGTVYDNTTKQCVNCQSKIPFCIACSPLDANKYQCFDCNKGVTNRIPNPVDKSTCQCDKFYFQNTKKQCQLCDNTKTCTKCSNQAFCFECNTQNNWKSAAVNGKCVCADTFVQQNDKCVACTLKGCLECVSQQTCKTCSDADGYVLDDKTQKCVCKSDRFSNPDTQTCDLCSSVIAGCKQCPNKDSCSKCDKSKNRNQNPNPSGKCDCQPNYTENQQMQCVLCDTAGCLNCQEQNTCTKCNTDKGFNETIDNGKCDCIQSKYLKEKQCLDCISAIDGCLTCQDQNTCTRCNSQQGFNQTITDGKCNCVDSKYLQNKSCLTCSSAIVGCQNCKQKSTCLSCNTTANFIVQPSNGACKCVKNYFVQKSECVICAMICQHCELCAEIVTEDLLTTSISCMRCGDDFNLQDGLCVGKGSNTVYYILAGVGVLTILMVIFVVYLRKRKAKKLRQSGDYQKLKDVQDISTILKQGAEEVVITERSSNSRRSDSLFNGNINYSMSSEQRDVDKRSFNDNLRQVDAQRKRQMQRKSTGKQQNKYMNLLSRKSLKKSQMPDEEQQKKQRNGLFSNRGKG